MAKMVVDLIWMILTRTLMILASEVETRKTVKMMKKNRNEAQSINALYFIFQVQIIGLVTAMAGHSSRRCCSSLFIMGTMGHGWIDE